MKDFANASFSPDTVAILQAAMEAAVATLPDPVSSSNVQSIAQSILRSAKEGGTGSCRPATTGFAGAPNNASKLTSAAVINCSEDDK